MTENDPDQLVEVFSTDNPIEADLIRNMLQSAGVPCQLEGENQAGLTGLGIMTIRLIVRAADQVEAKRLLDSMEHD